MELPYVSASYPFAGIIFAILFFFCTLFTFSRRLFSAHSNKRLPPEARGGWPVIGHLHLLSATEPTHITLTKMADAYGPIFTVRFGMYRALIVSNWEIARECFTTNDKFFASRPKLLAAKLLGYDYAMFGLSPFGSYWRNARKLATFELLTTQSIDKFQHIRTSEVQSSIKELYGLCVGNGNKALVDMKKWFGDITLNTIFRIVVGKRFSTAFGGCEKAVENEHYRVALRDSLELFGVFIPSDLFPFLRWLDLGGHQKVMKKTAKVVDEALDKWLKEHQQRRNSGHTAENDVHDFMDVMLSVVQDGEFPDYSADVVTKATCLTLILAGSDTMTITMVWVISLLLNNQEVLRKVQVELDEQVGRQRQVKESDIKNLIYLQAVVKETFRLNPPGPIGLPHESMEDCTVAGYHIPAGTRLFVNIQKLQRDPLVWNNPYEFRPERFLTSQKDFDVRGQNPQYIPFGSGRRMCPGASFAHPVLHLTLANLLHGFEIDRPSDELVDMEESFGITCIKKNPLEVMVTPRLPAQVYEQEMKTIFGSVTK